MSRDLIYKRQDLYLASVTQPTSIINNSSYSGHEKLCSLTRVLRIITYLLYIVIT